MPIYEYVCLECETRFEALRAMQKADEPIACQACGGEKTSRAISLFYAQSEGRVVAGGKSACSTCSAGTCSTCNL